MVVLGNHDLHLVSRLASISGPQHRDTLDEVLAAPDADKLVAGCAAGRSSTVRAAPCWSMPAFCRRGGG